jgi:hypothetical protein
MALDLLARCYCGTALKLNGTDVILKPRGNLAHTRCSSKWPVADHETWIWHHSLVCQGLVMTLMFFKGLHLRQGLHCVKVHKWSLKQMVTNTNMATILLTTYTQGGKYL